MRPQKGSILAPRALFWSNKRPKMILKGPKKVQWPQSTRILLVSKLYWPDYTYWIPFPTTRAQKGLFGPQSLSEGSIFGQNLLWSKYRHVGCPDRRNGILWWFYCSYSSFWTVQLEKPSKNIILGHVGPFWCCFRPFRDPCGHLKRPHSGPICHIIIYYAPENCFRASRDILGHVGPF